MKCCCEDKGTLRSGVKGILACPVSMNALSHVIERCDACKRFDSDENAAVYYATARGGRVRYSKCGNRMRIIWSPRQELKSRM
jgi:hypothetical protein